MSNKGQYIEVVVPLALPFATLTYSCTQELSVGCRVRVPVGTNRSVTGVVWSISSEEPSNSSKIKAVIDVLDVVPLLSELERRYAQWFCDYYMCTLSKALQTLTPQLFSKDMDGLSCRYIRPKKPKKPRKKKGVEPAIEPIVELIETAPQPNPELGFELGFEIEQNSKITLLHTTTTIDIRALAHKYVATGETTLIIAPTPEKAALIHKNLAPYFITELCTTATSTKKRAKLTVNLAVGLTPQIVVGTRSALLLPYKKLSAVIVTEEHSFYYKSYRPPHFSTKDSAIMLGALHKCKTLLMSAFPTVENYYNAKYSQAWSYQKIEPYEPQKELQKELQYIVLERGKEMISKYAVQQIGEALKSGKKAIVMQNRRGVASYTECDICSHTPQCPNCSTSLTLHTNLLGCHYCGHHTPIELKCSVCGGKMHRKGRGTQQLEKQLIELYPSARIARFDADTLIDSPKKIAAQGFDIAVGTLVVIDAVEWAEIGVALIANFDNMLSAPDFRAEEDAYRVVGRMASQCREVGAELIVQSSRLDYEALNDALENRDDKFYTSQIAQREHSTFPPHSRMIKIEFRGAELSSTMPMAQECEVRLRKIFGHRLSPLHQPAVERQRGEHIIQLLLKIERSRSSAKAKALLMGVTKEFKAVAARKKVTITLEADPS